MPKEDVGTVGGGKYNGAHAYIVAFDVSNPESFKHVGDYLNELDRFVVKGVLRVLVGTL